MNTGARKSFTSPGNVPREKEGEATIDAARKRALSRKAKVFIAAESRLVHDVLSRMIVKRGEMDVAGIDTVKPFRWDSLMDEQTDILVLTSRGSLGEDILLIREVRTKSPAIQIVMIGVNGDEREFLQYVRAGIRGYLLREASAEDVLQGLQAVHAGEVVCPGNLCGLLFKYFEKEATSMPSAAAQHRLGLTRREQQLVPLIAQGLTNKEIASHFYLSEQTVKNHLYRMKQKIGAENRLGIVQTCHLQGFLL
jgi:DNA-binding NarL/FixJ family response regulator